MLLLFASYNNHNTGVEKRPLFASVGGNKLKTLLVSLNAKYIHTALGLYSIAASCREQGNTVAVKEYTINQDLLMVLADIAGQSPDVVGFACYIWNRELTLKLAAALKKTLPDIIIVLGGPEVSADAAVILSQYPYVDFVVQGEGEASVPGLLAQLERWKNDGQGSARHIQDIHEMMNVPGVAQRTSTGIGLNGGACYVDDLDSLPFPYTEAELAKLDNRILYYESSRGCPYACSYCISASTRGVRHRSVDKVCRELRIFLEHQVQQVKFVDRTFNVVPAHYQAIWRFMAAQAGVTNFHFEIVADRLRPGEIEWLATIPAGLFQFEIGVQSICEKTLRAIGRQNDWENLRKNVQALLRPQNIHLHLDLIVGLPFEGLTEFQQSFNAVYDLQPHMLQLGFLKLLPGTPLRSQAEEYGMVYLEHPPYEILSNQFLPYAAVRQLKQMEEVFNQTYNSGRFSQTLAYLVKVFAGDPFLLYNELTLWWKEKGLLGSSHSPDRVLAFLQEFAGRFTPEQQRWVAELLKFDTICDGGKSLKGDALDWNRQRWEASKSNLWRDEAKMQRYIADYRFTNWREVKRKFPLEVFAVDVAGWLRTGGTELPGPVPIVFDLTQAKPRWQVALTEDFPLEDEL